MIHLCDGHRVRLSFSLVSVQLHELVTIVDLVS